ncbi:MAG: hypothetical protein HY062_11990 [Bacteroidetes bacterium]|nr:hypothetical protein [Bacteroidota bacterium]
MRPKKIIIVLAAVLAIICFVNWFSKEMPSINLQCTLVPERDTRQVNRTGLLWALSYLGAELPKGEFDKHMQWIDSTTFRIDFEDLGFSGKALEALKTITDSIKQQEYYKKFDKIDVGQFIALTVGSSWHYYAITNAPKTYEEFLSSHEATTPIVFSLNHSLVSDHLRVIKFNVSDSICRTYFIAEEGEKLSNNILAPVEFYEVLDVMQNGQLRFMVYDENGNLAAASPKRLGSAGKPAKCMWCHEIVFQPLFAKTDSLSTGISPEQFQKIIEKQNGLLVAYRRRLQSDIDFNNTQDHTQMELLYISYMEPSLRQLSKEWNVAPVVLKTLLNKEITHTHDEFKFLKELYHRSDIEIHAPCNLIRVPDNIREPGIYEPRYHTP